MAPALALTKSSQIARDNSSSLKCASTPQMASG
eukprot:CAMPEP_0197624416 /NCGR_PEP_ID=MMETSP1338-20131121/4063_1 /TAXON_ID=43686 ORGANISM="Pelagodinium beii, Strain RCC1491" /NCGR_SAMPLE_ID=MMETSP1338 /ASSEMBLY_ACC=CAM_ASM_000754 /LENGTH=32 /DNA_ID= /DNA_START= /DNA_END= /DNA_ORIENTATION=